MLRNRIALLAALGAAALSIGSLTAGAQAGAGTITGRVVWGSCARVLLPAAPDFDGGAAPTMVEPAMPETVQPDGRPGLPPIIRPTPRGVVPAGAVLVAVQGTGLSTRTDEAGRFRLENVPSGTYYSIAAGPVANTSAASAWRPNVVTTAGQSADVGTLTLGGSTAGGLCVGVAGALDATMEDAAP